MKNLTILKTFLGLALLTWPGALIHAQLGPRYQLLKAGIHFDSQVSGGKYSLVELAQSIARTDLKVAVLTDHDNMKVTYGIRPFENFLKFSIEENSIQSYGTERYFAEINALDKRFPHLILIPGVEAVPYYHWEGSPLQNNLVLKGWHTHLLVMGIEDPAIIEKLPSLAKGLGHRKPDGELGKYIITNIKFFALILFYFTGLVVAAVFIWRRKTKLQDIAHLHKKRHHYRFSPTALIITLIFGGLLYTHYPFLPPLYTQYDTDAGPGPFQTLIDYVNEHQGLIFWAHPEVRHEEKRQFNLPLMPQNIGIVTDAYPQYITETNDYTGFAIFWEGMKTIGKPGGLWDIALNEYNLGMRRRAPWAIGELDFEDSGDLSNITETSTFLFVKEASRRGVYEAMRTGRMYCTRGHAGDKFLLTDFSVYDLHSGRGAFLGETLTNARPPLAMHIGIQTLSSNVNTEIMIFRNEILIKKIRFTGDYDDWFTDEQIPNLQNFYYRIYIGENWPTMVTNPIFIKMQS